MGPRAKLAWILIGQLFVGLAVTAAGWDANRTYAPGFALLQTPTPASAPSPAPQPSPVPAEGDPADGVLTQVFQIVFSADTLSEALAGAFEAAAGQEIVRLSDQAHRLTAVFGEILKPPPQEHFTAIAGSSLATAAALAPALFVVRLALHHWQRLTGEEDSLLHVFGDWLAAGFTAVAAGPFLDLLVQAGWWLAGAALGETVVLAQDFLNVTMVAGALDSLFIPGKPSMFAAIIAIAGGLGGLVGVVGLAFAFAVSQAVLFVLGALAPVVTVIAVVPQVRWLRALWLKAAAVLALIPVAAGAIFKASLALSLLSGGGGFTELLIRIFWLWGAVGFMLSLAGILGKVTLSASLEGAERLVSGARKVVTTALSAHGLASTGAGAAAPTSGPAAAGRAETPLTAAADSPPATYQPTGAPVPGHAFGAAQDGSGGGFASLAPHFYAAGLDPQQYAADNPAEAASLVFTYLRDAPAIDAAPDPLAEAARLSGAQGLSALLSSSEARGGRA